MSGARERRRDGRLILNAFVMNTTSHIHHGQWRRPDAGQVDFNDLDGWLRLARLLEEAAFDTMFFADVSGHYGDSDADFSGHVREGLQIPSNDPMVLVAALAAHTRDLGLAITSNVFQAHPTQFARQVATLDHLSRGRIAWNVVTGTQDNGYRNFGLPGLPSHEDRYRWAEEYIEVLTKLTEGSWDEGALVQDRARGVHAEAAGVHKIFHAGERYRVEGPFLVAPSPQRTPVLFQAGSSEQGRAFAARHAEAVFLIAANPEIARRQIAETRRLAAAAGRDPDDLTFHQGLSFVVGDTRDEARARFEEIKRWVSPEGYALHGAMVDPDGRAYPADTRLSQISTRTSHGWSAFLEERFGGRDATLGELHLSRLEDTVVVGTADDIADELEVWRSVGVDGINVINWVLPGSLEEFVEQILPTLRARGLAQDAYAEGTLRRKWFGRDLLPATHPDARHRGAFTHGHQRGHGTAQSNGQEARAASIEPRSAGETPATRSASAGAPR